MFERYTEKARRVIFFARYEASQFGSSEITSEHLLLGLLREDRGLTYQSVPNLRPDAVRKKIEERSQIGHPIPTNVDLPLSPDAKKVLKYAAEESERLARPYIGSEHLLLGLLDEQGSLASVLMREAGADAAHLRERFAQLPPEAFATQLLMARAIKRAPSEMIQVHNFAIRAEHVRHCVRYCHMYNWQWSKTAWRPKNVVVDRRTGRFSLDTEIAGTSPDFELLKDGWKKDHCIICRWKLFESDNNDHGVGYTNGREWLCTECYEKFVREPGFSPTFGDDLRF